MRESFKNARGPWPRVAGDDATLQLCGPCRHFQQSLFSEHRCNLGLPLLDGVRHTACVHFDPFARGEGNVFEQSDCCAQHAGQGH